WGREVKVTPEVARRIATNVAWRDGGCRAIRDMTVPLPLKEWQAMGVRLPDGGALPKADIEASMVSGTTRHLLVYRDYDALLGYNCANSYALGVALLADRIERPASAEAPARSASAVKKKPAPARKRK